MKSRIVKFVSSLFVAGLTLAALTMVQPTTGDTAALDVQSDAGAVVNSEGNGDSVVSALLAGSAVGRRGCNFGRRNPVSNHIP